MREDGLRRGRTTRTRSPGLNQETLNLEKGNLPKDHSSATTVIRKGISKESAQRERRKTMVKRMIQGK